MKEAEIQRQLFEPLGGFEQQIGSSTNSRTNRGRRGHLPTGKTLEQINADGANIIGENFAPRTVIATIPERLNPEEIAIAGGWCSFRNADFEGIESNKFPGIRGGVITDPLTGEVKQIKSVSQVLDWVEKTIAFDQIVEAIGSATGGEYFAISESTLWAQKLIRTLEEAKSNNLISLTLSQSDKDKIAQAVADADTKRVILTERYLCFILEKNINLKRVNDGDITQGLQSARDELFENAGISVEQLQEQFPTQAIIIPSKSQVWSMYSQPYFDMLRKRGIITKPIVIICEPTKHSYAADRAGTEVVKAVYQRRGIYLEPNGINPNVGFISYMECVDAKGTPVQESLTIDKVPNMINWKNLFDTNGMFDFEQNVDIDPAKNQLFIWAVNLIPIGSTLKTLLAIAAIKREFNEQKKNAKLRSKEEAEKFKEQFLNRVRFLNQSLSNDLRSFFEMMTDGL